MSKILAIDFGKKRTGLAITDSLQMIASPLKTVDTSLIWKELEVLLPKEKIETVVVGEARYLNGDASQTTMEQAEFVAALQKKFPSIQIARVDETFTSKMAAQAMVIGGVKKSERQKKENLDMVSAAIILQSYLEYRR
jgi:putative Holliday junction resolvase